jgi:aspartyl-tRNA synthetase
MDAFQFGAPHGGRFFRSIVAILGGQETIRDFIAFRKITQEGDVDAPSSIDHS